MLRSSVHSAALLAAAVLAVLPSSALAAPSSGDAGATSAYLQADYALARAEAKNFPTAIAAVEAFAKRMQAECPGVVANAPKPALGSAPSSSDEEISEEELDAVFDAAASTEHARRERFAREVAALHWSDGALTRFVHAHAADEAAKTATSPPDLCADMRSWVASGYQSVSAATERYLSLESALSKKAERAQAIIKRELPQFESPADKRVAHAIARLESAEPPMLKEFLAALSKVGEALSGPSPAPTPTS
jgi:hypothetical protein